jgi:iron complex outermembrane recepter protein
MVRSYRYGSMLLTMGIISIGGVARAQQAAPAAQPSNELAEIVVTAEKRSERLIDVPIAITVVSAEQLDQQHVYNISDLARTTPSLEMVQAFGGPGGGGQIRGIGTNSFSPTAEGAVGIVVDGVPQGNVNITNLFDLQQVEVLKGPQGTLFGLTASAGVINMTTAAPDPSKFEVKGHVDYSNLGHVGSEFGETTVRGSINMPISPIAAVRLAVSDDRIKGVQVNNFTGQPNLATDWGARLRFLVKPTDALDVNLIADYDRRGQNYSDPQFTYVSATPGLAAELAACGITANYDNNARCGNNRNDTNLRNYGGSAQFDYHLPGVTLTSITGYRKQITAPTDTDIQGLAAEALQIFSVGQSLSGRQFTQEFRLTNSGPQALEYTAGVFYSNYSAETHYSPGEENGFQVHLPVAPPPVPPLVLVQSEAATATHNKSAAVFGQLNYHVTEQLGILAGLRYTHQSLDASTAADPNAIGGGFPAPTGPEYGSLVKNNVSGLVGLQYAISEDLKSYFKVVRGYKGPQVNPAANGNLQSVIGAEIPTMFELGIKGSSLERRLSWDADVFYSRVHDYQGQSCALNPAGVLACQGQSVPQVTTKGVEINLRGQVTKGFTVTAGYVYDVAQYPNGYRGYDPNNLLGGTDPTNPLLGTTDLSHQQLVGVPKNKLSLAGDYGFNINDNVQTFLSADTVFKSAMRLGPTADPRFVFGKNWNTGLRLGVRSPVDTWSVALFARNLGKDREPVTLFGGPAFIPPGVAPPFPAGTVTGISGWATQNSLRQVGITADVKF